MKFVHFNLSRSSLQGLVGQEWSFKWALPLLSKRKNYETHFVALLIYKVLLGLGLVATG
jgi:hypothetical protein